MDMHTVFELLDEQIKQATVCARSTHDLLRLREKLTLKEEEYLAAMAANYQADMPEWVGDELCAFDEREFCSTHNDYCPNKVNKQSKTPDHPVRIICPQCHKSDQVVAVTDGYTCTRCPGYTWS